MGVKTLAKFVKQTLGTSYVRLATLIFAFLRVSSSEERRKKSEITFETQEIS